MKLKAAILAFGALVATSLCTNGASAQSKYTFYHLLWGMSDANVQFHIKAGEEYMKSHPDVTIKYVGPENYDPAEHAKFLDTILSSKPDGVALHISSVDALLPGLRRAKDMGVPVVSVTSHPPSAEDNKKLEGYYLTWVGADEQLIGTRMGEWVVNHYKPVHAVYLMGHLGHAGHEMRAKGFLEAMPEGVKGDRLAIGEEPEHAKDVLRSFLSANPDVNVMMGGAPFNKWVTDVVEELGRTDIALLTSDDAPSSLEAVETGKYAATFSQEFPIQAPFAYEVLYNYQKTKMYPVAPIITGPMIVDKDNVKVFKDLALQIFGEENYYKLSPY